MTVLFESYWWSYSVFVWETHKKQCFVLYKENTFKSKLSEHEITLFYKSAYIWLLFQCNSNIFYGQNTPMNYIYFCWSWNKRSNISLKIFKWCCPPTQAISIRNSDEIKWHEWHIVGISCQSTPYNYSYCHLHIN